MADTVPDFSITVVVYFSYPPRTFFTTKIVDFPPKKSTEGGN